MCVRLRVSLTADREACGLSAPTLKLLQLIWSFRVNGYMAPYWNPLTGKSRYVLMEEINLGLDTDDPESDAPILTPTGISISEFAAFEPGAAEGMQPSQIICKMLWKCDGESWFIRKLRAEKLVAENLCNPSSLR